MAHPRAPVRNRSVGVVSTRKDGHGRTAIYKDGEHKMHTATWTAEPPTRICLSPIYNPSPLSYLPHGRQRQGEPSICQLASFELKVHPRTGRLRAKRYRGVQGTCDTKMRRQHQTRRDKSVGAVFSLETKGSTSLFYYNLRHVHD